MCPTTRSVGWIGAGPFGNPTQQLPTQPLPPFMRPPAGSGCGSWRAASIQLLGPTRPPTASSGRLPPTASRAKCCKILDTSHLPRGCVSAPPRAIALASGKQLVVTDGANHRRLRAAHSAWLSSSAIDRMRSDIERDIEHLLADLIAGGGSFDAVKDLGAIIARQVLGRVLGIPDADWAKLGWLPTPPTPPLLRRTSPKPTVNS